MSTEWECFRDAVNVLAGSGTLKQRLGRACQDCLCEIAPEALPAEHRQPFSALTTALQAGCKSGRLTRITASILKMSEADAERHAHTIVSIFIALQAAPSSQAAVRGVTLVRERTKHDEIPAFLNLA